MLPPRCALQKPYALIRFLPDPDVSLDVQGEHNDM
ncbi:hypothetical protein EVA_21412 [gut metagenome]|uniref:Uncharacterized protein n=1 Tax=gut metagenome TaxID=749906 RepID=J9F6G1_9ZZZZ